jgi:triosephosphate isomerase
VILVLNLKTNLYRDGIIKYEKMIHDKEVIVLPQYPYLLLFRNGKYQLGSQDVSKFKEGSYTGEVCAEALKHIGCRYALIGHAERKEYFNEDVKDFRLKIQNTLDNDLIPIYSVSETLEEYNTDNELKNIELQLEAIPDYVNYIMVSYEPSWLMGEKDAQIDYEHVNKVLMKIKEWLMERNINHSILYGGGINTSNIDDLKELKIIDGILMCTSALDEETFNYIYNKVKE